MNDPPDFETRRCSPIIEHRGFSSLFSRIVANSTESENPNGCWKWTGLVKARYPRLNIRTPDGAHRQIRAHRAVAVLMEIGAEVEHFWDLYYLYSVAEFEGDHICGNPLCVMPDHIQLLTKDEHDKVTKERGQGVYRKYSKHT
jgi:HNH endonuclease